MTGSISPTPERFPPAREVRPDAALSPKDQKVAAAALSAVSKQGIKGDRSQETMRKELLARRSVVLSASPEMSVDSIAGETTSPTSPRESEGRSSNGSLDERTIDGDTQTKEAKPDKGESRSKFNTHTMSDVLTLAMEEELKRTEEMYASRVRKQK